MVGTIGLAGCERGDRRPRKEQFVLAGAMAVVAAVSLGGVGAVASRAPLDGPFVVLAWIAAVMFLLELLQGRARYLPMRKRQVNAGTYLRAHGGRRWRRRPRRAPGGYGWD